MNYDFNYDLFAHIRDEMLATLQKDRPVAVEKRLQNYKNTRNLASISASILGVSISPGMAWQLAECSFLVIRQKVDELDNQIRELEQKKKRAEVKQKRQIEQKIKNLERSIKGLRPVNDIKPIWGTPSHNGFSVLSDYTQDDDKTREKEAYRLPPFCFRIKLSVPMKTPVIIKGDRPFVANENLFCTDKITGWPLLLPSTLKGQARHATLAALQNDETSLEKLFGPADVDISDAQKSRIEFFPCYIKKEISFDVLAPHDETTRRIQSGPIPLEVLPHKDLNKDLKLTLWLQYWPVDLISTWILKTSKAGSVKDDLINDFIYIVCGLLQWFGYSGIGAKTSSGYGQVDWKNVEVELSSSKISPWSHIKEKASGLLHSVASNSNQQSILSEWEEAWKRFEDSSRLEVANEG